MTLEEALKVTNQDIANYLGAFPKKRCTVQSWGGKLSNPPLPIIAGRKL